MAVNKNSIAYLFIALLIFFPGKFIHLYFAAAIGFNVFVFYMLNIRFSRNELTLVSTLFLLTIALFFVRYLLLGISVLGARDVYEYGRLISIVFLTLFVLKVDISRDKFFFILKVYLFADILLSLGQLFFDDTSVVQYFTGLYGLEHHVENSLHTSSRVLGLSSDPSAHGLMVLVILSAVAIKLFFFNIKISIFELVLLTMSCFVIFLTQSQTAFIGLLLFFVFFNFTLIYYRRKLIYPARSFVFLFVVFFILVGLFSIYYDDLRYLTTLFEYGLDRSSYLERQLKLNYILGESIEHPIAFLFTGFGKEFFGDYTGSMDNELLYILVVWGGFFFLLFTCVFMYSIYVYIKRRGKDSLFFTLPFIVGLPLAWPSSYYLAPKISLLLLVFYSFYIRPVDRKIVRL